MQAAGDRARSAQLGVKPTARTFGLPALEPAAIRPRTQGQCRDLPAAPGPLRRTHRLGWNSRGSLDRVLTAPLDHQFLVGKG